MKRSQSSLSVKSHIGDLSSGRAFHNGCTCAKDKPSGKPLGQDGGLADVVRGGWLDDCRCGAPRLQPQLEFVTSLMTIGKKLSQLPTKEAKSECQYWEVCVWILLKSISWLTMRWLGQMMRRCLENYLLLFNSFMGTIQPSLQPRIWWPNWTCLISTSLLGFVCPSTSATIIMSSGSPILRLWCWTPKKG